MTALLVFHVEFYSLTAEGCTLSAELRCDGRNKVDGFLLLCIIEVEVVICDCGALVHEIVFPNVLNNGGASQL